MYKTALCKCFLKKISLDWSLKRFQRLFVANRPRQIVPQFRGSWYKGSIAKCRLRSNPGGERVAIIFTGYKESWPTLKGRCISGFFHLNHRSAVSVLPMNNQAAKLKKFIKVVKLVPSGISMIKERIVWNNERNKNVTN